MSVRKSLDEYDELVARIAWLLAPEGEKADIRSTGEISRGAWLVHGAIADHGGDEEALLDLFGTEEQIASARKIHEHVERQLGGGAAPYNGRRVLEPRASSSRRLGEDEFAVRLEERALALGVEPAQIKQNQQGTRSPRHDKIKRARQLIVAEGARAGFSIRTMARVLGRAPSVVHDLCRAGQDAMGKMDEAHFRDLTEQIRASGRVD